MRYLASHRRLMPAADAPRVSAPVRTIVASAVVIGAVVVLAGGSGRGAEAVAAVVLVGSLAVLVRTAIRLASEPHRARHP
jgi:hypothetical protein